MSIFHDDPSESGEDRMNDAIGQGCILAIVAVLLIAFVIATIVKVWA